MNDLGDNKKWTVSQVERLISLPRRFIQRCCYSGKGGVDIVRPKESEWGHRYYEAEDMAWLYLVARCRDRSMSLPEAKRALDAKAAQGLSITDMLGDEAERLSEEIEELQARLIRARALKASLSDNAEEELDEIIQHTAGTTDDLSPGELAELPGLDLAIELRHGSGTSEG